MKHYAGLDVSMKETFVCVVDQSGKKIRWSPFAGQLNS